MTKRNAFSLIELMVVMTIIIVISAVAMINYSGSTKKARDSRRIADLEKIRMALEVVRQSGTTYPDSLNYLEPNFMSKVPVDPKSGSLYSYDIVGSSNNYKYILGAEMEDLGSTNGEYADGNNYQVTNP